MAASGPLTARWATPSFPGNGSLRSSPGLQRPRRMRDSPRKRRNLAMIDKKFIGHVLDAHSHEVEKGRLRFFAKATGQKDAIYVDEAAARAAGFPTLPAPPTFFFCLESEVPDPW